ncbi:MAG: ATP-dependent zinc protease [Magnetococcales bacterium]|nr:ATP-dependent zinc protease [Magnetococcales bacterium]
MPGKSERVRTGVPEKEAVKKPRPSRKERSKTVTSERAGWREWVGLPTWGVARIKAKLDTGARTSALHGVDIRAFRQGGIRYVRFKLYPSQHSCEGEQVCVAPVLDRRAVRNSSGIKSYRYVVLTLLRMGAREWPIELTLTDRARMGFRLLIGRTAIRKRFLVDPGASFLQGEAVEGAMVANKEQRGKHL